MAERTGVAVAGTHVKSSTTAMTSYALLKLGADPSFVIGGTVPQLGGGSRFLGVTEDCGRFLHEVVARLDPRPTDPDGWDVVALDVVRRQREAGRFVPGLGQHVHKEGDPRTTPPMSRSNVPRVVKAVYG